MDHTEVGLRSVLKALTDVVAPAVDPGAAQAKEQLRLAIDYIEFVAARLAYREDRERFELRDQLAMAGALREITAPGAGGERLRELATAIERGEQMLQAAGAPVSRFREASAALAAAIAAIVRDAAGFEAPLRRRIEQCVVRTSKARIAFERSWYVPLGFDPDAKDVPPLQDVIDRFPIR